MMSENINAMHEFITQIENHLRRHNVPAALDKCTEAKTYIKLLSGVVKEGV